MAENSKVAETKKPSQNIAKHTATPWRLERDTFGVRRIWDSSLDCDIASAEGDGSIASEVRIANAEFIVRAVNNHQALLDALKYARRFMHETDQDILYLDGVIKNAEASNE